VQVDLRPRKPGKPARTLLARVPSGTPPRSPGLASYLQAANPSTRGLATGLALAFDLALAIDLAGLGFSDAGEASGSGTIWDGVMCYPVPNVYTGAAPDTPNPRLSTLPLPLTLPVAPTPLEE